MPTLVTVNGLSFSGTTLLDVMLGTAPRSFSCGEIGSWFRPSRATHRVIRCGCRATPCPLWHRLGDMGEHRFHAELCRRLDLDFVIDSSKKLTWVHDSNRRSRQHGLAVANVVIWKRLKAQAYSYWKRQYSIATAFGRLLHYYRQFFSLGLPFVAVGYHDLLADPDDTLGRLGRWLGMADPGPRKEFWSKTHHNVFGSIDIWRQQGNGRIRQSEAFPPEFDRCFAEAHARFPERAALEDIVHRLEAADFSRQHPRADVAPATPRRILPFWYYQERFKDLCRRLVRPVRLSSRDRQALARGQLPPVPIAARPGWLSRLARR